MVKVDSKRKVIPYLMILVQSSFFLYENSIFDIIICLEGRGN